MSHVWFRPTSFKSCKKLEIKYEVKIIKGCDLTAQCFSAPKGCEQEEVFFFRLFFKQKKKQTKPKQNNKKQLKLKGNHNSLRQAHGWQMLSMLCHTHVAHK